MSSGSPFLLPFEDLSIEGSLPGLRLDFKFGLQFGVVFGWLHGHPFRRVGPGAHKKTLQKLSFWGTPWGTSFGAGTEVF